MAQAASCERKKASRVVSEVFPRVRVRVRVSVWIRAAALWPHLEELVELRGRDAKEVLRCALEHLVLRHELGFVDGGARVHLRRSGASW